MIPHFVLRKSRGYVELFLSNDQGEKPVATYDSMEHAIIGICALVQSSGLRQFIVEIENPQIL